MNISVAYALRMGEVNALPKNGREKRTKREEKEAKIWLKEGKKKDKRREKEKQSKKELSFKFFIIFSQQEF